MIKILCQKNPLFDQNAFLLYDEEGKTGILLDPGCRMERLEARIEEEGLAIEAILLTHGHADHIGAADFYRQKYGAPIGAAEAERELLLDPSANLSPSILGLDLSLSIDQAYHEGDILPLGIRVIASPGHTVGSLSYLLEDALFSGDTLFNGEVGRWDFPTGSLADLRQSLKKLLTLEGDKRVYPGHGDFSSLEEERQHFPLFDGVREGKEEKKKSEE